MVKKNKDSLGIADCEIYLKENELEWLIHSKQLLFRKLLNENTK